MRCEVMITSEQFNGLNFKKIREHSKEIEEYDGFITLVRPYPYKQSNSILEESQKRL